MKRYLSVCSGIEAASAAWMPLGWRPVAFSEIEPFPKSVLAHHHPGVPNWGDMTKYKEWPDAAIDVLCGGTPCQSFSVAGLRRGLDDPRGNLMLTFGAIAAKYRPRWLVWENVPGVLSSNGGRDFGAFLGLLAELGYGFAYRVLDAQYVRVESHPRAVPQRRRRVFVVGHSGGQWQRAAAVLFERASLCGHPAPSRKAGKGVAPTLSARTRGGGGLGTDFDCDGGLIAAPAASTLNAHFGDKQGLENQHIDQGCPLFVAHSLRGEGFDASEDGTGRGTPLVPVSVALRGREGGATVEMGDDVAFGLRASGGGGDKPYVLAPVAFAIQAGALRVNPLSGPDGIGVQADHAYTLEARAEVQAVASVRYGDHQQDTLHHEDGIMSTLPGGTNNNAGHYTTTVQAMQVRRLTPVECEKLQGFEPGYTAIPWRGKPADQCPDGPRYKALGNSWAVNCARWIGERIEAVEAA